MAKIIGTRWTHNETGEVLVIQHTSADRTLHQVLNETTGRTSQIGQGDLDRDWTKRAGGGRRG